MSDETPDPIAQLDQMIRGLMDMAKVMRAYHAALRDQGFDAEEALALTMAFQTQMQRGSSE